MTTFVLKNLCQLFDKHAVARTEHNTLVKSTMKIFSNFLAFSENPNFNKKRLSYLWLAPQFRSLFFLTSVRLHLRLWFLMRLIRRCDLQSKKLRKFKSILSWLDLEIFRFPFKVHIFWKDHKILRNIPLTFDCMYCSIK